MDQKIDQKLSFWSLRWLIKQLKKLSITFLDTMMLSFFDFQ